MIHPDDTFTVFLDEDTPEAERADNRPAVVYRYGTAAELRQHERKLKEIGELHGAEYIDALEACASANLIAMRNLNKPDGTPAERLSDALSIRDLRALATQLTYLAELSEADRKNFGSPSPTPAAASVETASPASA